MMAQSSANYWLLIERLANWELDHREGFRQFGLSESRKKLAATIAKGDYLIFYVSERISCFADVRVAAADGISVMPGGGSYDTAFPWRVSTAPYLTLPRDRWLAMNAIAHDLSVTAGKSDWRPLIRHSLRKLPQADGELLVARMHALSTPR